MIGIFQMVLPPAIIIRRPAALGLPEVARIIIAFVSHVLAHIQGDLHCLSFAVPPIPFPVKQNCISSGCTSQFGILQNVGKDISASAVGTKNEGVPFFRTYCNNNSARLFGASPGIPGWPSGSQHEDGTDENDRKHKRLQIQKNTYSIANSKNVRKKNYQAQTAHVTQR